MQRDNLEVQGKKAVSGEVGGHSKVNKVGAHSSSQQKILEVSQGQEDVPTSWEDRVLPQR